MVSDEIGHAQRRVADYVLSNHEEVIRMSITQLSEASEASEATVVRLMQSVGFDGYNDFKISLSRSMSHNETELERNLPGRLHCRHHPEHLLDDPYRPERDVRGA